MANTNTNPNRPVAVYKAFPLEIAIWQKEVERDSKTKVVTSAKLSKSYKDGDEWKSTQSFNLRDLPTLQVLLHEAFVNFGIGADAQGLE